MQRYLKGDEYLKISYNLQKYHKIFEKFWNMSTIVINDEVPTAAIFWTPDLTTAFKIVINPTLWDESSIEQKLFFITHEYLHLILEHNVRFFTKEINREVANIATDLAVNQTCLDQFRMDKSLIDPENKYFWAEHVFPDMVSYNKSSERYYKMLMNNEDPNARVKVVKGNSVVNGNGQLVDSHDGLSNIPPEVIQKIMDELTAEEKQLIKDWKRAAPEAGKYGRGSRADLEGRKVKILKFQDFIKTWTRKSIKKLLTDDQMWTRPNKRITALPRNLFLPSVMQNFRNIHKKDKLEVAIFIDASGSCDDYKHYFAALVNNIDLNYFIPKIYSFDTSIFDYDMEAKEIYGGGGTSFAIIEEFIQQNYINYPDSVFVLTDGGGDDVSPQIPSRWFWFLSENYITHIPKASQRFLINKNITMN